jgi:hypothetical protein
MRAVSRFESELLRILHALLGRAPLSGALPLIVGRREPPKCLGRDAVELIQETLAKGCVWRLARMGGWLPERHLRGDRVAAGRLWERTPPEELGLTFSGQSLALLIAITAHHPGDKAAFQGFEGAKLTVGDGLLAFFAFEALREAEVGRSLRDVPLFSKNDLCRLAFPEDFPEKGTPRRNPDPSRWIEGPGGCVLEALQPYLASRWLAVERAKRKNKDAADLSNLGRSQGAALEALLPALDAAGRWDLARFLLVAGSALLGEAGEPRGWFGPLVLNHLRVAERAEVHRAALAFLRSFDQLRQWERRARAVGYFDEGYAASQLWKADWETHGGDRVCERAGAIARALDPLGV